MRISLCCSAHAHVHQMYMYMLVFVSHVHTSNQQLRKSHMYTVAHHTMLMALLAHHVERMLRSFLRGCVDGFLPPYQMEWL